ncbi:MAG TPA: DedA family protein [Candidatus Paceibacterota bacterium]|nr:DedA family protein [Verrucomicrobiota bacterium]HRY49794.1 DedA family protein [Candidatus Paceibacterota bacterium]
MFKGLIDWYLNTLETGGYPLIALLMAIESSIVPLPSEVIIPPAAHLAHTKGIMGMTGIVIAGAIGSWIGATVMYAIARWGGRPLVMRYGYLILVTQEKLRGAERWAARYGSMGVFISRLLPVVRHLIGLPAGIVRLDYMKFSFYTLIGSALWCAVLCWFGIKAGANAHDLHRLSYWIGGAVLILAAMYYVFVHRFMKDTPPADSPETQ